MTGKLFIVSGPSGVGKDTIIEKVCKLDPSLYRCITMTTRDPRFGEVTGVDYDFVSMEEFEALSSHDMFLETAEVHGHWYGTPKMTLDRLLSMGKDVLLKIDVQGYKSVKTVYPDCVSIFIHPECLEDLESQIRERGDSDEDSISCRLEDARYEIEQCDTYDYEVVNRDVVESVCVIKKIIEGERY